MLLGFAAVELTLNDKHIRTVQSFLKDWYFVSCETDQIWLVFQLKRLLYDFTHELRWKYIRVDILLPLRFFQRFELNLTAQLVLPAYCNAFTLMVCQFIDVFHLVNHLDFVLVNSFLESKFHVFTDCVESDSVKVIKFLQLIKEACNEIDLVSLQTNAREVFQKSVQLILIHSVIRILKKISLL